MAATATSSATAAMSSTSGPKEIVSAMIAGMLHAASAAANLVPTMVAQGTDAAWAALAGAPVEDLVVLGCYLAVIAGVAVETAVHWQRPDRTPRLREARAAGVMAAGALAVGVLCTALLRELWVVVGSVAPSAASSFWDAHPVLATVSAFVAWDLVGFCHHQIGHRTAAGWAAHRPHHTGREYQLALGLRLSWLPWHSFALSPLLALAGWNLRTIIVCAAVSNLLQALQHTATGVPVPRLLAAVVMTPEHHRHHHAVGGDAVNLGPVLTCWDRLAGSYRSGPVPDGTRYGLEGAGATNPMAAELDGLRALVRRQPIAALT